VQLAAVDPVSRPLFTVGHGTSDRDALAALLVASGVDLLVDIRAHPGSRRNPDVGRAAMEQWLPENGIAYRWEPRLGGRRKLREPSANVAWRDASFRAYADYMMTAEFAAALDDLLTDAHSRPTVMMCSESTWWRCHRRLVADAAVLLRGELVVHIFHDGRRIPHEPNPDARVENGHLVYDGGRATLPDL
jgi:uncharacterized protein (DUF488 family)